MLITVIIIFTTLILPIFIKVWFNFSGKEKKLFFCITIFGFIKIISGYAEKIKEGIAVHISKNKAFIFTFKNIFDARNKVKPLKDYHVIRFESVTEIGSSSSSMLPLLVSYTASFIDNVLCWFLYNNKPQLHVDNKIFVFEGEDRFEIFCKFNVVLNALMLIISLIKILMEKLVYANGN